MAFVEGDIESQVCTAKSQSPRDGIIMHSPPMIDWGLGGSADMLILIYNTEGRPLLVRVQNGGCVGFHLDAVR